MKTPIVLVTGGAGFIGSHICEELIRKRYAVVIFDDFSNGRVENIARVNDVVKVIRGDIQDKKKLESAVERADYIIHEAAMISVAESIKNPAKCYSINIKGTRNILDAALRNGKIRKVVLASSAAVYGTNKPPLRELQTCEPISPYGKSKLANENDALRYYLDYRLPVVCLRYFNVYGPRQCQDSPYAGVISKFITALKSNSAPVIYGDGNQTRDFAYVKDVADATVRALGSREVEGEVINIATGKPISINELFLRLKKLLRKNVGPGYKPGKEGDIKQSYADVSKAKKLLKFQTRYSLEKGLKELLKE